MNLSILSVFALALVASCAFAQAELPHANIYDPKNDNYTKHFVNLPGNARSLSPTFQTDPPKEKFRYWSQAHQDEMLLKIFNDKSNGYFVDLAANHWQYLSNTYVVEYYNNWKGICIEPNPEYFMGLLANRKCIVVSSPVSRSKGEIVKFRFHVDGEFGGIVGEGLDNSGEDSKRDHLLATTTLTDILRHFNAPPVMDYLSLDVEGAEQYVLQGLDSTKYQFRVVTIERPKHHSHHLLAQAGYRFVYQMSDFGECMYLHRSIDKFPELMKQYAQDTMPSWPNATRPYLLHPKWNEEYAGRDFINV